MTVGLRALEEADLEQLRAWRNQPEVMKRTRQYRLLTDYDQKEWWRKLHSKDPPDDIMFGITWDGMLVGVCGLCHIDWVNMNSEVSIYIGELSLQRKGVGREAIRLLLEYGFNKIHLHRIWAETYKIGDESLGTFFEKCGFKPEGVLRHTVWREGYADSLMYSILEEEWGGSLIDSHL